MLSVAVLTYNHQNYIAECLEGIFKQQTEFEFELVIADDASTDFNIKVIEKLLTTLNNKKIIHVKRLYNKINLGISRNFKELMLSCSGKYIAICEGDDYWIDPKKLQKQITILENNPDCIACVHNAKIVFEKSVKENLFNKKLDDRKYKISDLITDHWFIPTASIVFLNSEVEFPIWFDYIVQGDLALMLLLACKGEIFYLDDIMSVYRKNPLSIGSKLSASKIEFQKLELLDYFDLSTSFKYHELIKRRKTTIHNTIHYNIVKEGGVYLKYLNIEYYIFKWGFLLIKLKEIFNNRVSKK